MYALIVGADDEVAGVTGSVEAAGTVRPEDPGAMPEAMPGV